MRCSVSPEGIGQSDGLQEPLIFHPPVVVDRAHVARSRVRKKCDDAGRSVEFEVTQDGEPWIRYSQIGYTWITQNPQHYRHEFVMVHPSDPSARIELNTGESDVDVYVDNISLTELSTDVPHEAQKAPVTFQLYQNFPNPFNPDTEINYTVPKPSRVRISIYTIQGRQVLDLVNRFHESGTYSAWLNASDIGSGVYLYQMSGHPLDGALPFRQTKKMILLK